MSARTAQAVDWIAMVPARAASTRLPGKALADIGGVPMVVRTAERARQSGAARVLVATDEDAIAATVKAHGFEAVMTSPTHPTGTDRLAQACALLGLADETIVVNVQGDEPLIHPGLVAGVATLLARTPGAAIATAAHPMTDPQAWFDPNVVKVVCAANGLALYFSRAPVPWARDALASGARAIPPGLPVLQHIGLYAYRAGFLAQFPGLPQGPLERFESLEQLRALEHGHAIVVHLAEEAPAGGVDTPADLERVRAAVAASAGAKPAGPTTI